MNKAALMYVNFVLATSQARKMLVFEDLAISAELPYQSRCNAKVCPAYVMESETMVQMANV
jgi:hypothetical protein